MKSTKKWTHPLYAFGFCRERNGIVYTEINYQGQRYREATFLTWHANSMNQALIILEERIKAIVYPKPQIEHKTVMDLFNIYASIHFPNIKQSTRNIYIYAYRNFLSNPNLSILEPNEIRDNIIANYQKSKLSHNTKVSAMVALRSIFAFGVDEGYMPRNPISKHNVPNQIIKAVKVPTSDEINELLEYLYIRNIDIYYLVKFISLTACRISESLNIIRDEDIAYDSIRIRGKGDKGNKERIRFLPLKPFPELIDLLMEMNAFNTNGKLFKWKAKEYPRRVLNECLDTLKLKNKINCFHSVRKYCENKWIRDENLSLNIVAQMCGHTIAVMEKYYKEVLGVKTMTEIIMKEKANRSFLFQQN